MKKRQTNQTRTFHLQKQATQKTYNIFIHPPVKPTINPGGSGKPLNLKRPLSSDDYDCCSTNSVPYFGLMSASIGE